MKRLLLFIIISGSLLQAQKTPQAKNKLQSLILPGWGEYRMEYKDRARGFFIREVALWIVCIGGKNISNWYESDYLAFAELHAGVDMYDKDYLFAINMGHYDSFTEYNEDKARQRQKMYSTEEGKEWQWDSDNCPENQLSCNRISFDKMRIQSVTYDKYASFAIGALVLHRLISFIDIIYLERRYPDLAFDPHISLHANDIRFKFTLDL